MSRGNLLSFYSKIRVTEVCWHWTAYVRPDGYGQFRFGAKRYQAHRFAYELIYGAIPQGLVIDHRCRRRSCVNPGHLELVTNRENILRGVGFAAQQARKTHCKRGHLFDKENTLHRVSGKGKSRVCRMCKNARELERKRVHAVRHQQYVKAWSHR